MEAPGAEQYKPWLREINQTACKDKPVVAVMDVISLKLREVLILDKRSLARGHLFVVKILTTSKNQAKRKLCDKM